MEQTKQIITICPDYDFYLQDADGVAIGLDELIDRAGSPIVMPEMDAWAREVSHIVVASETGQPYDMDWADYHQRGLALAHKLRRRLSSRYELWYEAPYEDKSGTVKEPVKIEAPFNLVELSDGYYLQCVMPEEYQGDDLIIAFHHFKDCSDDGCCVDTYSIVSDDIDFEDAGFNFMWEIREEDIWLRITKEQYDVWGAKIESLKSAMFSLAREHVIQKSCIEVGDVILDDQGIYRILEICKDPIDYYADFIYIGKYGVQFNNEADWMHNYDEINAVKDGLHVDGTVYDMAVDMAQNFTLQFIAELKETIYNG